MEKLEYEYLYVVSRSTREGERYGLRPGTLLFWDYHGRRHVIHVLDMERHRVEPLAEIVLLKRLHPEERLCLSLMKETGASMCDCIPWLPAVARLRLWETILLQRVLDACHAKPKSVGGGGRAG